MIRTNSIVYLFPGHLLSMGYGFVEYKKRSDALKAIKELQVLLTKFHGMAIRNQPNLLCGREKTTAGCLYYEGFRIIEVKIISILVFFGTRECIKEYIQRGPSMKLSV